MHISKHNYAIELEQQGHMVYFMNPPNQKQGLKDYVITKIEGYNALFVIDSYLVNNRLIDFLRLRLKFTQFYDWLLFQLIKRICRNEKMQFEQVWSFDPNLHGFLYKYPAVKKVFFIADKVQNKSQTRAAKHVDIVVSVAEEVLEPFRKINNNCLLINHGLNRSYEQFALKRLEKLKEQKKVDNIADGQVHVGYIGNLLIPFLYEEGLKQIVAENPGIIFHFWGAHSSQGNNLLAAYDHKITATIDYLKANCKNVFFYGVKTSEEIINNLDKIDLFIYINSSVKDINGGANSHKILEYLSSGKVVVSTYLSFYEEKGLLMMTPKYAEQDFVRQFSKSLSEIELLNSSINCFKRIEYALQNTYATNIKKIQEACNN